ARAYVRLCVSRAANPKLRRADAGAVELYREEEPALSSGSPSPCSGLHKRWRTRQSPRGTEYGTSVLSGEHSGAAGAGRDAATAESIPQSRRGIPDRFETGAANAGNPLRLGESLQSRRSNRQSPLRGPALCGTRREIR